MYGHSHMMGHPVVKLGVPVVGGGRIAGGGRIPGVAGGGRKTLKIFRHFPSAIYTLFRHSGHVFDAATFPEVARKTETEIHEH